MQLECSWPRAEVTDTHLYRWRVKNLRLLAIVRKPPPRRLSVVCAARPLKTGKMKRFSARVSVRSGCTATVPVSL